MLYKLFIILSTTYTFAQNLTCSDFSVTSLIADSSNANTYKIRIKSFGTITSLASYPHVAEVYNCSGQKVAVGNMFYFGQLGQTTQDYTVTLTGQGSINCWPLTIKLVINNPINGTDTCTLILGITKLYTQIPSMIRIFPNPVHHTIKINVPENLIKQTCIFYNNFGQQVYNCILEDRETTLSLPFLSCGLYYIQIGPHCFMFTKTT